MRASLIALLLAGCTPYQAKEPTRLVVREPVCQVSVCHNYGRIADARDCQCVVRGPGP